MLQISSQSVESDQQVWFCAVDFAATMRADGGKQDAKHRGEHPASSPLPEGQTELQL